MSDFLSGNELSDLHYFRATIKKNMKHTIFSLILFFGGLQAGAQNVDSLDQEVGPMVGINEVAIRYFGIEFGTAQRNLLAGREGMRWCWVIEKGGWTVRIA